MVPRVPGSGADITRSGLLVVEMVQKAGSNVVGDYYLVFKLARRIGDTVSRCNQEAIRSELGMSDVVAHLIVLVAWFVVGNFARSEMCNSGLARV